MLLTDGSEKTDQEAKETKKGKEAGKLGLAEEERERRVNSLLFSELGIVRDNVERKMVLRSRIYRRVRQRSRCTFFRYPLEHQTSCRNKILGRRSTPVTATV